MEEKKFSEVVFEQSKILSEYLKDFYKFIRDQATAFDRFYDMLEKSRAIHLYGKGRTANAAISLALRLKHFGYNVWFVGDTVKERIKSGDLVILFSGSGETAEVVNVGKRAKIDGASVIAVTSYKESTLAKYSDLIIILPGGLEKGKGWAYLESQISPEVEKDKLFYGGGEFETLAYLLQETLISGLGRYKNIPSCIVFREHERDELMEEK